MAFDLAGVNAETMVEDPLGSLTLLWDWAKSEVSGLLPELRQVVDEWVGFGMDLSVALQPRVALFFRSPQLAEIARFLPPFVWLNALDPEIVGGVRFSSPHVAARQQPLAAQPVEPGAALWCEAFNSAGLSVASESGTLGALLSDTDSPPNRWILSAAHVAGLNVNLAEQWPRMEVSIPGLGPVSDQTIPVPLTGGMNKADAAIARLKGGLSIAPAIPHLPVSPGLPHTTPNIGSPVSKFGMATKLTAGIFAYHAPRVEIELAGPIGQPHCKFQDQLLIRSQAGRQFAGPGDSGALVVSPSGGRNYPFGLLIAWQEIAPPSAHPSPGDLNQPTFAVATPFTTVLDQLKSVSGLSLSLLTS